MNLHLVPGHAAAIQLLVDLPWLNGVFEMFHVYPFPVKLNSLQLQACSLLLCSGASQSYLAADPHDAMPRQLIYRIDAQQACDGTMVPWIAGCRSNSSIGSYSPGRNGKDHAPKRNITLLVRP